MLSLTLLAIVVGGLALVAFRGDLSGYRRAVAENKNLSRLAFLAPYSLALVYRLNLEKRIPKLPRKIHHNIILLHGQKRGMIIGKFYFADAISVSLLLFTFFCLLGAMQPDNYMLMGAGVLAALIAPYLMQQELENKVKQMKQEITIELPEFLNKLILLVNAGETVQKALIRCVKQKEEEDNALYKQLRLVAAELENGYSFHQSIEEFSKRCGVQEATVFSTTLLLNYNKGGEEFVDALREIARDLWEKRKNITKTLGEKASSKMLFPMMFIFLVIMVIVGYPALALM